SKDTLSLALINLVIVFVPPAFDGVRGGHHQVAHALLCGDASCCRGGYESDAAAELEHVDLAEPIFQHVDRSGCRVVIPSGELHERGLARTIRAENDPPLGVLDTPIHTVEDRSTISHIGD